MTETQIEVVTNKQHEVFNLLELPDPKSQLIRKECLNIKRDASFENLTSDFAKLTDLIRLAENGAYDHCEIQIQIRDIGRIITQLAGDTSVAILAFEKTSEEMAETWKIIYEYLLSSFEDEALIMLGSVKELNENMLNISVKLKGETKLAAEKVKNISNAANKHKQEDINNCKTKEALLSEKVAAEKRLGNLETEIEVITKNVEKAEKSAYRWGIVNMFVPFPIKKYQNAQELADSERKEKQRLIEEHRSQIAARREANEKIATFSLSLLNCKTQSVLATEVIKSLDHAFSALNNIEGIIEAARIYWEKMYTRSKQFSNQNIDRIIKNGVKKDNESKQNLYRSPTFKRQTVKEYAKCIALKETCLEYKKLMEKNHINLIKYLKEHSSREQSISIVKNLSEKLFKETEITKENLRREEEELNEQEANLDYDIQANIENTELN
ncbi:hypothetical protein RhiirA5_495325 [Rhizophagus irregularis]|uniref:Uncharacterized protein n=3 Tax=Rhizophagus irregularis TaxID=588596 RepID=A0A2N0Q5Z2_9GLOM|nr:hypothetical protein GLOIN_2v1773597 [Rhizophagus irregularis DAOM 181602=DAOM 197198]PKC14503.1 hypothetical protein RhiirA5_495325 [Rhizophagus irregularis]POG72435.1 hypothetical protein GLOIN_2v1773597 [Rhizophagus irregularis DAOM 181602=DAOM 197198]UZO17688.1 hypothetical protein OCT59_009032 [Rhizophagus irregularis]CAG8478503.1 21093_t:CDS:2 [Rhizophagus irregularis]GBC24365.2 tropomyosin beta chain [Rhizophagus irregularis DAOM 181602=DAOM 197198]|eukprot:XP_025179301.1 hypothetical protein GLOIN_2v1773597 [Rhizophagus irregularis DAOM 181602=DAOM 197198]